MSAEDSIVVEQLAPRVVQEGFNPYYDCRMEYDKVDKTRVIGRWMQGEYYPVNFGHANKAE